MSLRIAYVCYLTGAGMAGVAAKIDAQIGAWRKAGNDVEAFCLVPEGVSLPFSASRHAFTGLVGRYRATSRLAESVEAWRPDVAYLRYDIFLPPVWRLVHRVPTVAELNADLRSEAVTWRSHPGRSAAARLSHVALLTRVSGYSAVTGEVLRKLVGAHPSVPVAVVPNGIAHDSRAYLPAPGNDRPRLVFTGTNAASWNGVDHLLELAAALPDVDFDLIGPYRFDSCPPNVCCLGMLGAAESKSVFARADAGIGPLGYYRKGENEACTLKVRAYLAAGLPVVVPHVDTAFRGESPWFVLNVPNAPDGAITHSAAIRQFLDRVRGRRVPWVDVASRIGIDVLERERLALLERVASGARPLRQQPVGP